MRLASFAPGLLACVAFAALAGCVVDDSQPVDRPGPVIASKRVEEPPTNAPAASKPTIAPEAPKDGAFAEVVYVMMRDATKGQWFCTGTLINATTVVTAAHCLDTKLFVSYLIVAPLAKGQPRVAASKPASFGGDYNDVANPDIGILTLDKPIVLPAYAELTDVTARVAAGEKLSAAAVVRTAEKPEASLQQAPTVPLSSTVEFGYEHGFGTPLFTKGGDSGAGLFLVENGKPTHKLIGVARQPDPARGLDHFTRIDPAFLAWYADEINKDL